MSMYLPGGIHPHRPDLISTDFTHTNLQPVDDPTTIQEVTHL